jgi:hypothetical protein
MKSGEQLHVELAPREYYFCLLRFISSAGDSAIGAFRLRTLVCLLGG